MKCKILAKRNNKTSSNEIIKKHAQTIEKKFKMLLNQIKRFKCKDNSIFSSHTYSHSGNLARRHFPGQ